MELRRYFAIVQRSWWLVLGVPLLVLLVSLLSFQPDPQRYRANAKFAITHAPVGGNEVLPDMNIYNSWQSTQFIVDDLPGVVRSEAFAQAVSTWIASNRNLQLDAGTVKGMITAVEQEHRIATILVDADTAEQATAIAAGSIAVLDEQGLQWWNRAQWGTLAVETLELPTTATALSRWPQPITRLALRLVLALVAGFGLAFLRHYLDRTVREQSDLAQLNVPVLGAIPKES